MSTNLVCVEERIWKTSAIGKIERGHFFSRPVQAMISFLVLAASFWMYFA